ALGAPPGSVAAEHVGIPAAGSEPEQTRYERACRLALIASADDDFCLDTDAIERDHAGVGVRIEDPYLRGVVLTRLKVALHSEGLGHWPVRSLTGSVDGVEGPSGDHGAAC
ncbi:MAG: hypothetical protein WBG57_13500, partial [Ornithinimicrobium sp.]